MESYLSSRSGPVSIAVDDVRTGHLWTLGPDMPQITASIVKVDLMADALHQQQTSGQSPSEELDLMTPMIEESDDDAATGVYEDDGSCQGLATFDLLIPLTATVPGCPTPTYYGWGNTTTTATDQIAIMKLFAFPNALLDPASRQFGLNLLEHVDPSQAWGVSTGVPAGVTVALKNGWKPVNYDYDDWQINSVGWISGDGRDYLVAVLSTGSPDEQYGIDTVDQVSSMIWAAMGPS